MSTDIYNIAYSMRIEEKCLGEMKENKYIHLLLLKVIKRSNCQCISDGGMILYKLRAKVLC